MCNSSEFQFLKPMMFVYDPNAGRHDGLNPDMNSNSNLLATSVIT